MSRSTTASLRILDIFNSELATKRLELLRVLVPGIKQVAVIVNSTEAQLTER